MGLKRIHRVEEIKNGYHERKRTVIVPVSSGGLQQILDKRIERGYRKGYLCQKDRNKFNRKVRSSKKKFVNARLKIELSYMNNGARVIQSRRTLSKPSRPIVLSSRERWLRKERPGRFRVQTTEGRKTLPEARQKELGGIRVLWRV